MGNSLSAKKKGNSDALSEKEIKRIFKEFDANKDGNLTSAELKAALDSLGIKPTTLELKAMFLSADKNKDGMINIVEFREIVRNCPMLEELQRSFRLYDKDGDGAINVKEFKLALAEIGQFPTDAELQAMFAAVDANNDSKISFTEFAQIMRGRPLAVNLKEVFGKFDADNDGFITANELRNVCETLNIPMSERDLDVVFKQADENMDGKLTLEEFSGLLTKGKMKS